MGKKRVLVVATLALVGVMIFGAPALAGTMLTATLTGAAEVPGPGDDNGSGTAELTLLPKRERICLKAPSDGSSMGCVRSSRMMIKKIKNDPSGYYVNVHNDDLPDGALRGQLAPSPQRCPLLPGRSTPVHDYRLAGDVGCGGRG